jgi:hypothetical protein
MNAHSHDSRDAERVEFEVLIALGHRDRAASAHPLSATVEHYSTALLRRRP